MHTCNPWKWTNKHIKSLRETNISNKRIQSCRVVVEIPSKVNVCSHDMIKSTLCTFDDNFYEPLCNLTSFQPAIREHTFSSKRHSFQRIFVFEMLFSEFCLWLFLFFFEGEGFISTFLSMTFLNSFGIDNVFWNEVCLRVCVCAMHGNNNNNNDDNIAKENVVFAW